MLPFKLCYFAYFSCMCFFFTLLASYGQQKEEFHCTGKHVSLLGIKLALNTSNLEFWIFNYINLLLSTPNCDWLPMFLLKTSSSNMKPNNLRCQLELTSWAQREACWFSFEKATQLWCVTEPQPSNAPLAYRFYSIGFCKQTQSDSFVSSTWL